MRLEATVPDSRGVAVDELARELGVSRSQVIDEALTLFLKAVLEMKRGRRLVMVGLGSSEPVCELTTSTLTTLEWTFATETVQASAKELVKMKQLHERPPASGSRLRKAAKNQKK